MASLESLKYIKTINKTLGKNSEKDVLIGDLISDYNRGSENSIFRFHVVVNSVDGKDVYVNESITPIRGVVDIKKKQGASSEEEYVLQTLPNQIKTGDIVRFKMNETDVLRDYLITSGVEKKKGYDEYVFLECNQTLKWIDKNGNIHEYPCIISNDSYGSKTNLTNDYLAESESKAKIEVQFNEFTKQIPLGMRFIFNNSERDIYQVIDMTTSISKGVIAIINKKSLPRDEDDFDNNLAFNAESNNNTTEFKIVGQDNVKVNTQSTYSIEPISDVIYSIDDNTIAKIVSQGDGNCIIEGKIKDELFILTAMANDIKIAEKSIFVSR